MEEVIKELEPEQELLEESKSKKKKTKSDVLRKAKEVKNDEFYTQIEDIVNEIAQHKDYVKHFEGKTVFCNCDDPEWSSFVEFFRKFFKKLKLKKMIATHYNKDGSPSYKLEWYGEKINGDTVNMIKTPLKGNGDFRSDECIELLKESDIVVTNPPFSLFREYVAQIMEYNKKFVILGNTNAVAYKEFFPLIKDNKVWIGYKSPSGGMWFKVTDEFGKKVLSGEEKATYRITDDGTLLCNCPAMWYTNLDLDKVHEPLILTKNYKGNEDKYPKYENFDAIDIGKIADIPKDYFEKMGVPITFLAQYCPEQFEIIGSGTGDMAKKIGIKKNYRGRTDLAIKENGKDRCPYNRIIIQRKPLPEEDK